MEAHTYLLSPTTLNTLCTAENKQRKAPGPFKTSESELMLEAFKDLGEIKDLYKLNSVAQISVKSIIVKDLQDGTWQCLGLHLPCFLENKI